MARAPKSKASNSRASSSGCQTPRSHTSDASPKERVGSYELVGLIKAWDDQEETRDSIRDDNHILRTINVVDGAYVVQNAYVEGTLANVVLNHKILEPLIDLMGQNQRLLPNLDNLIQCIDSLYRKAKKAKSLEHADQMAWGFRRLIGVVKGVCYKDLPPQDCHSHQLIKALLVKVMCFSAFIEHVDEDKPFLVMHVP